MQNVKNLKDDYLNGLRLYCYREEKNGRPIKILVAMTIFSRARNIDTQECLFGIFKSVCHRVTRNSSERRGECWHQHTSSDARGLRRRNSYTGSAARDARPLRGVYAQVGGRVRRGRSSR